MKVVIAGASGLVGSALAPALRAHGHEVVALVRRAARGAGEVSWNPATGELAPAALAGADAVVNLAGEAIAARWWTATRRAALRNSRIQSTRTLVDAMARMERRAQVLVNASAVGYYGDRGDEVLTENSAAGRGFLPELCMAWESEASRAETRGVRVVWLRTGLVLAKQAGVLAQMLPAFRLGLGARLGDGRAWTSWITLEDLVRAIAVVVADPQWRGAINAVAPRPVTNREFTAALGRAVRRPAFLGVPAGLLRLALGDLAREALLASARVEPAKLAAGGFAFQWPDLPDALGHVLGR